MRRPLSAAVCVCVCVCVCVSMSVCAFTRVGRIGEEEEEKEEEEEEEGVAVIVFSSRNAASCISTHTRSSASLSSCGRMPRSVIIACISPDLM